MEKWKKVQEVVQIFCWGVSRPLASRAGLLLFGSCRSSRFLPTSVSRFAWISLSFCLWWTKKMTLCLHLHINKPNRAKKKRAAKPQERKASPSCRLPFPSSPNLMSNLVLFPCFFVFSFCYFRCWLFVLLPLCVYFVCVYFTQFILRSPSGSSSLFFFWFTCLIRSASNSTRSSSPRL